MTNDNNPRRVDPRRVYRVPFVLTVTCDAFVLADSLKEAERQAKLMDYNSYIDFDTQSVYVSDGEGIRRMKFDDVVVSVVDISGITVMAQTSYAPNKHPDFVGQPQR